jgi:hypothetical protein
MELITTNSPKFTSVDYAYFRIRSRNHSQAAFHRHNRILQAPICPFLALFLIFSMAFFSWFSNLVRSRSTSR